MKILDTDHCVAILRGQLDVATRSAPGEELAITSISVAELTHGAHKSARASDNLARLDVLFGSVSILNFDERAARRFGLAKSELERAGTLIGDLDLQIASIAIETAASLVTHNRQHFARINQLVIEDWL